MTANQGLHVMAGLSMIGPSTDVQTDLPTPVGPVPMTSDSKSNWWVPPHAYASLQASEKTWLGIGIYCPFGLGSEFDSDWIGRYNSYKAIIESVTVNPNVAYKVDEKLSVALGLQIMTFDLELKRKLPNMVVQNGPDFDFSLEGDSVGYGGNAALSYQLSEQFGLGLVYRSEVQQTVKGDANLTAFGNKTGTAGEGDITLPASSTFGANYKTGKLMLGGAVTFTEWSSYDELVVKFSDPAFLGVRQSVTEKDWNNVWRYSVGAEYALSEQFDLRCSYVFDEDPSRTKTADYMVPSNDRHLLGAGAGWHVGRYRLDLGYTYLMIEDRNDIPARYEDGFFASSFKEGDAHIVSASLAASF
jgi:long-chain fatty acid transport protein